MHGRWESAKIGSSQEQDPAFVPFRVLLASTIAWALSPPAAAATVPCDGDVRLTRGEVTAFDAEARHGLYLGMSETEFKRLQSKWLDAKSPLRASKDKTWTDFGATLYVLTMMPTTTP